MRSFHSGLIGLVLVGCGGDTPMGPDGPAAIQAVVAGNQFSSALDTSGVARCWGANDVGQLGRGTASSSEPAGSVAGGLQFDLLAAGDRNVCGLSEGRV